MSNIMSDIKLDPCPDLGPELGPLINTYAKHQTYIIHMNGSKPYVVYVTPRTKTYTIVKTVFENKIFKESDKKLTGKYIHFWNGYLPPNSYKYKYNELVGSNLLFQIDDSEYIFVGSVVKAIKYPHQIVKFYSLMGNSDCPYSYGVDYIGNLLMFEYNKMMDRTLVKYDKKIYSGFDPFAEYFAQEKKHAKPIKTKQLKI